MSDLISRQDAIDACFHGGVANNYDCAEEIEKLPSAQKWKRWKMTRAEAIQILSTRGSDGMPHGYTSGYTEALDMAIEALQAQATLDDVSNAYENGYQQGKFEAQEWIPCSERLPEDEALCCDVHQNLMFGYVFTSEKSNTGYSAESEHEYMYDCVAWMPLPSPYKGE